MVIKSSFMWSNHVDRVELTITMKVNVISLCYFFEKNKFVPQITSFRENLFTFYREGNKEKYISKL